MGLSLGCMSQPKKQIYAVRHSTKSLDTRFQPLKTISPSSTHGKKSSLFPQIKDSMIRGRVDLLKYRELRDIFVQFILSQSWAINLERQFGIDESDRLRFVSARNGGSSNFEEINFQPHLNLSVATEEHNVLGCFPPHLQISLVIGVIWSVFLESNEYKEFFMETPAEPSPYKKTKKNRSSSDVLDNLSRCSSFSIELQESPIVRYFKRRISDISVEVIYDILKTGVWLDRVIESFDDCFVNIFIGRVSRKDGIFPILYYNKSAEINKKPDDLLTKGKDLLQYVIKGGDKIPAKLIENSFFTAVSTETYLPSYPLSKDKFLKFVKSEPVFDEDNKYRIVLCTSVDVSYLEWDGQALKAIDELMWMLRCFI